MGEGQGQLGQGADPSNVAAEARVSASLWRSAALSEPESRPVRTQMLAIAQAYDGLAKAYDRLAALLDTGARDTGG